MCNSLNCRSTNKQPANGFFCGCASLLLFGTLSFVGSFSFVRRGSFRSVVEIFFFPSSSADSSNETIEFHPRVNLRSPRAFLIGAAKNHLKFRISHRLLCIGITGANNRIDRPRDSLLTTLPIIRTYFFQTTPQNRNLLKLARVLELKLIPQ